MGITIVQRLIPSGIGAKSGRSMTPQYVTIHNTGNYNAEADAQAHARALQMGSLAKGKMCWHYTVDDKDTVYQSLLETEQGWHTGDGHGATSGNATSIGIEVCEFDGCDHAQAEDNAARLTASILLRRGWGIERVKQHHDWSGKDCPKRIRPHWPQFLAQVSAYMTGAASEPLAQQDPVPRILRQGDKGEDVRQMQRRLLVHGYALPKYGADGSFGAETLAAVREFQQAKGLAVDGLVGPKTLAALEADPVTQVVTRLLKLTSPNLRGDDVRWLQGRLNGLGHACGAADGIFGPKTERAVRAYQAAVGLAVDGKAGKNTVTALGGHWEG